MAALLLDSFASVFLGKLANAIVEEVGMLAGVTSELEALERKVRNVRCLLADADRRELHEEAIRLWLAELRDVVYDADDIIDDFGAYGEAPPEKPSSSSSTTSFLRKILFHRGIGKRIKGINKRLDEIYKENGQLKLTASDGFRKGQMAIMSRQTSPVGGSDIVGVAIELHASSLMKILTQDKSKGEPLVAIIGMGGIGKTTLAQRIYNDEMIKANFEIMMWVCVSKEYEEASLLREIMLGAGVDPGNFQSNSGLVQMLTSLVHGKKLLLVMDDVWRADVWVGLLRDPLLQSVSAGSKILITTRFETVARRVGAAHMRLVEQMSVEDGWSLLCNKAFVSGDEAEIENLKDVGARIVERCGGLPLAIKLIGGTLRCRGVSRREWEEVLMNPVWTSSLFPRETNGDMEPRVMEALYLSYESLPSHLKQCFLYLSLFPEDHVFFRRYVIQHWIAEGFVEAEGDISLESKAEGYFKELISRSLLQPKLAAIEDSQCKMHDLLRCLAQFLAQGENFFGDVSKLKGGMTKLRRLSIADGAAVPDLEMLKGKEFLRSLYLQKNRHGGVILSKDVVKKVVHLRLLDLSGVEIEELPDAMRNLGHLRYLNISGTPVKGLPEWIGDLKNLQFLLLNDCKKVDAIPTGITKLKNLRCLEAFEGTEVDKMPMGIRGLVQLRKLIDFTVEDGGTLDELGPLVNLHVLGITKLERILDKEKVHNAAIKDKKTLRFLSLESTLPILAIAASCFILPCSSEEEEIRRKVADVFDELCPPSCLEILNIIGYMGLKLPNWMWPTPPPDDSPLQNVTWIGLVNCIYCSQLPPLGLLRHLKKLWIKGASAVTNIGSEFLRPHPTSAAAATPISTVLFPTLEMLAFMDMPNLKEWHWEIEGYGEDVTVFPCLQNLYIEGCPKLRSLPQGWWHGPKRMYITDCSALKEVGNTAALELVQFEDNQMETLPPWLGQIFINPASNSDNDTGILAMKVKFDLLKRILYQKQGVNVSDGDWQIIKHIPSVYASATDNKSATFSYMKSFSFFNTNIELT